VSIRRKDRKRAIKKYLIKTEKQQIKREIFTIARQRDWIFIITLIESIIIIAFILDKFL
jgi:hypothetical protein